MVRSKNKNHLKQCDSCQVLRKSYRSCRFHLEVAKKTWWTRLPYYGHKAQTQHTRMYLDPSETCCFYKFDKFQRKWHNPYQSSESMFLWVQKITREFATFCDFIRNDFLLVNIDWFIVTQMLLICHVDIVLITALNICNIQVVFEHILSLYCGKFFSSESYLI